jgi:curved DNA-binding protein CbpA
MGGLSMWSMGAGRTGRYLQDMNDPYEILQVHRRAEPEVIRAAYRALARKYHPDFGGEPARMAAISEAFAILSDADRRSAHDAQAARTQTRRATDRRSTVAAPPNGIPDRRASGAASGSVVDFGRYAGWTIGALVNHDPEYLEWLARTPAGRRFMAEIEALLTQRHAQAAALRPAPANTQSRRSFMRPWATAGAAAR